MIKHLGDKLIDYAWDTLEPEERTRVENHVLECADCRSELSRHQALVKRVADTVPAMIPPAPARVRAGWSAVANRVPRLRAGSAGDRHGQPGFVAIGLAMSTALLLMAVIAAQAWLGLGHPPLTATAPYPTSTPIASATFTPDYPSRAATPVGYRQGSGWVASPVQIPRPQPEPVVATTSPQE